MLQTKLFAAAVLAVSSLAFALPACAADEMTNTDSTHDSMSKTTVSQDATPENSMSKNSMWKQ
jgi:pentapeptide MXKDX repeat protein